MTAKFVTAANAMASWRDDILAGARPKSYPVGQGELSRIEVAPNQITLLGGAPGSGKTALAMQFAIDALRLTPTLRAVVCNIEMSPTVLLDRQLARLSGVSATTIRFREIPAQYAERIDAAMNSLDELGEQLAFVKPPFDLGNVVETVDEFAPVSTGGDLLLVLDYIQRIAPPRKHGDKHGDKRGAIDATMSYLRQIADAGAALLVVSSVGRQKNSRGSSSYDADSLDLASFKESGELEFGADDAFILAPAKKMTGVRQLKHLKARHGECRDMLLRFDGARQSFEPLDETKTTEKKKAGGVTADLSQLWNATEPGEAEAWKP